MDFRKIAHALGSIAEISSTYGKEALLRQHEDIPGFKDVLRFIYDKNIPTGLKAARLRRVDGVDFNDSPEFIMHFLLENNTGSDYAATRAAGFVDSYADDDVCSWAAEGLVTKDLQIGVNLTVLNKVYGKGFIPKIGIMRGMLASPYFTGDYIATEKLDGNRRLIMTKETGIEIYTRSGKRDYGWKDIEAEAKELPLNFVYDCELLADGEFADSIAQRQATSSIASSKQANKKGCTAHSFDMLPLIEYNKGRSAYSALTRKILLAWVLADDDSFNGYLAVLPKEQAEYMRSFCMGPLYHRHSCNLIKNVPLIGFVRTYNEALLLAEPLWKQGREGLMLAHIQGAYVVSPNPQDTLLKIKLTQEYTCEVHCVNEGDNKYVGMCGSLTVIYHRAEDNTDYLVDVGTGISDYQRSLFWENPKSIIGKRIEVETFGESRNKEGYYSLNCPRFKRIVGDID